MHQVVRIVMANPFEGERYYLRLILNHVVGATSYEHMRIVGNVTYATFRVASEALRLTGGDE